jgi:hypothetical protein
MGTTISVGHEVIADIDDNTVCINKLSLMDYRELVHTPDGALCGDIDNINTRVTKGRHIIRGQMEIDITGAIVDLIVPKLGVTNTSGTIYELGAADTLPSWTLDLELGGARHAITGCYWTKWAFAGTRGSRPIRFIGEFVGTDETEEALTGTKNPLDVEDIYAFTDISAFSIDSTSRATADRVLLQVDNDAVIEFGWSTTLTAAVIGNRTVTLTTSVAYTPTHDDLHWDVIDDTTGLAIVWTFASAQRTVSFSMPKGVGVPRFEPITGKGIQIRTSPTFFGHRSDSTGTRISPLVLTLS